jgi:uncharacterized C2H2 Zn-finger protein
VQKGTHSWDIVIHYHRCPQCGMIIESRKGYDYKLGKWLKDLTCERCGKEIRLTKSRRPAFGPLIGDPEPYEIEW